MEEQVIGGGEYATDGDVGLALLDDRIARRSSSSP
jgi:hypothetical protein